MGQNRSSERDAAIAELLGKSWADLEAIESQDRLMFRDAIRRRRKDGVFEAIELLVMPLREHEKRRARVTAREWAKEEGIDPEHDRQFFENMEALCELTAALRNPKPLKSGAHEQFVMDHKELERMFDFGSLKQVYDKLSAYERLLNPQEVLSDDDVVLVAAAIAERRDIVPLAGFDLLSQMSFIVRMAELLSTSTASRS